MGNSGHRKRSGIEPLLFRDVAAGIQVLRIRNLLGRLVLHEVEQLLDGSRICRTRNNAVDAILISHKISRFGVSLDERRLFSLVVHSCEVDERAVRLRSGTGNSNTERIVSADFSEQRLNIIGI